MWMIQSWKMELDMHWAIISVKSLRTMKSKLNNNLIPTQLYKWVAAKGFMAPSRAIKLILDNMEFNIISANYFRLKLLQSHQKIFLFDDVPGKRSVEMSITLVPFYKFVLQFLVVQSFTPRSFYSDVIWCADSRYLVRFLKSEGSFDKQSFRRNLGQKST